MSIGQKIGLSLGILIAGYLASVGFGSFLSKNWEHRLHHVSENLYTASVQSQTAVSSFEDEVNICNDVVIAGNMGNGLESAKKKADEAVAALQNITQLKLDAQRLDEVRKIAAELKQFNTSALSIYEKAGADSSYVFQSGGDTKNNLEDEILRIGEQTSALRKKLSDLRRHFSDELKEELADISSATRRYRYVNLLLFLGIVGFAGVVAWIVVSRSITRPLKQVIENLSDCSKEVVSLAAQATNVSDALAQRSFQQAASIEEVSASLEEMSSMTNLNAGNADQTRNIVGNALLLIEKTDRFMADLMSSMMEISKASKETSKIVKTIDEIAFQTNLLSLNAAVEAARAGEAGAGFAVVAGEVRNLALRSAEAAKNTSRLIEENVKKIEAGEQIASDTIQTFKTVAQGAEHIRELISEVATASDNQAQGIEHVNKAIAEMDQVTQRNAGTAEEAATASRQMNARAAQMKTMIDGLTAMVKGRSNGRSKEKQAVAPVGNHLQEKAVARPSLTLQNGPQVPLLRLERKKEIGLVPRKSCLRY